MRRTNEWGDEQVEKDASAAVEEAAAGSGSAAETKTLWFFIRRSGRRIAVAIGGGALIIAGVAMLVLPGPGWITIFAGLALLATEFLWAERLLHKAKRKAQQAKEAVLGKKEEKVAKKAAKKAAKAGRMGPVHNVEPLETERLRLRPYELEDLDDLARILGDTEGMAPMGGAFDIAASRSWIERSMARYEEEGFGRYAIILEETGELVGDCGIITTDVEGVTEQELGWIVDRRLRGQGIATEAAVAWRDHAFGTLGLKRIISMVDETNVPSRRVAEKIGMSVERVAVWGDGLPYLMYAVSGH